MQTATRSRAQLIASFLCALVAVTSPTTRTARPGPGNGCRVTNSSGRPSSRPRTRTFGPAQRNSAHIPAQKTSGALCLSRLQAAPLITGGARAVILRGGILFRAQTDRGQRSEIHRCGAARERPRDNCGEVHYRHQRASPELSCLEEAFAYE